MMFGKEKGAFGLYHSLHMSFFKVKINCARGERLINNVGEGFGNLNSIFCLLTEEEMDGMVNIGGGKLFWTTTSGLLKLRTLFRAKFEDGGGMDTSSSQDRAGELASIEHGENYMLWCKKV